MLTERGANRALRASDLSDELLAQAAVLHLTGYTLIDGPRAPGVRELIDRAHAAGVVVSLNPGSAGFIADFGPADFVEHLNSWKGSALGPAHTLRQSAFFRAGNVSTKVGNLYFAGSSTIPGIGLPMCLISAELVIKRMRDDSSAAPLAEPLTPRKDSR